MLAAFMLSVVAMTSLAAAKPYEYNDRADEKAFSEIAGTRQPNRTYRGYSYAPPMTVQTPVQAAPAPVVAQPAPMVQPAPVQQPQAVAQQVAPRATRSYSYQPTVTNRANYWPPNRYGLGRNGDHYFSRSDDKAMGRSGQGW
jgi:hypothetical protein